MVIGVGFFLVVFLFDEMGECSGFVSSLSLSLCYTNTHKHTHTRTVHDAKPTIKNTQAVGVSWASKEMGFRRGSGRCHSVRDSPYSLVILTRCSHLNKSEKLCFAVAQTPTAMGSAGRPVDSMILRTAAERIDVVDVVVVDVDMREG